MKNIFTILVIALTLKAVSVQAQTIPNNGFELLNSDGSLSNWGNVYLVAISIDTNGNTYTDSIVYDNKYYAPTNDAHGGNTALELRNAWNFTTNTGIAGAVGSDDDSIFSVWGLLNLVPTYGTPFTPFAPFNFGFYYKYFPVNGDSAAAHIALWDSSGNQLAEGEIIITSGASSYSLTYAPINYTMPGDAAFYSLSISTFYTSAYGSHSASFGTRLLVDDVGFNFVSISGLNSVGDKNQIKIHPNPSSTLININPPLKSDFEIEITNALGRIIIRKENQTTIDISILANGVYFVKTKQGDDFYTSKFVKQ